MRKGYSEIDILGPKLRILIDFLAGSSPMVVNIVFVSFTTYLWWLFSVTFWLIIRTAKPSQTKLNYSTKGGFILSFICIFLCFYFCGDHPCHATVSKELSFSFFSLVITSVGFQFLTHVLSSQSLQITTNTNITIQPVIAVYIITFSGFLK